MKHAAKRSISPIARSVAPNSKAPASDVIAPPSNPATTARPSTGPNSNSSARTGSALHSVGIGALLESSESPSRKRTFADSAPRCAYGREISGLVDARQLHETASQVHRNPKPNCANPSFGRATVSGHFALAAPVLGRPVLARSAPVHLLPG